ncbi:MAG TPA: hypothetical protein VFA96_01765 [Nocardioides sp.]|nr:hypothetical protein [Nocardioides sp.]
MRNPGVALAGVVIVAAGVIFTAQGTGALQGSPMSNTTTWSVAGPVIVLVGLVLIWFGVRRRSR